MPVSRPVRFEDRLFSAAGLELELGEGVCNTGDRREMVPRAEVPVDVELADSSRHQRET